MTSTVLSIIIPCYNIDNWLSRAVESVLAQSFVDWELILVDDGSTDDTGKICGHYANCDERIKVIRQSNQGQAAARNAALEMASGNYVCFVDGDDLLLDNLTFEKSVAFLEENLDVDFVQFPSIRFSTEDQIPNLLQNLELTEDVVFLDTVSQLIEHTDIVNSVRSTEIVIKTAPWGKIYRMSLFEHVRFPEGMVFEDTYMFCGLFERVRKAAVANTGLYGNFERVGSTTCGTPQCWKMQDKIKAFCKIFDCLLKYSDKRQLQAQFYVWLLNLIAAFKAMFGKEFVINSQFEFLSSKSQCLKFGDIQGRLIMAMGIKNYVSLRKKYYVLKQAIINR